MATKILNSAPFKSLDRLISICMEEDLGSGDITSRATISENQVSLARYIAKEPMIVAGLPLIEHLIHKTFPELHHTALIDEGSSVPENAEIGILRGATRQILAIERVLLNFLQRFCGIATIARQFAKSVEGSTTKILDTRKTMPGYRELDKYAVRVGGCYNHRMGLYDRILIKDNHIAANGSAAAAVRKAREHFGDKYLVEVEVNSITQFKSLQNEQVDWVLLDNMNKKDMEEIIHWKNDKMSQVQLEASGNMTLERVKEIGFIGLDYISVGALTHSVRAADISLLIKDE